MDFVLNTEPDVPAESLVGCYMDDSVNPDMGQPLNESQFYNMTRLNCACQCVDEVRRYRELFDDSSDHTAKAKQPPKA